MSRVNGPDRTDAGDPDVPVRVQPVVGMSVQTPPCVANHSAAAMGDASPPVSLTKERLNDRGEHGVAVWIGPGGLPAWPPQALIARRPSPAPRRRTRLDGISMQRHPVAVSSVAAGSVGKCDRVRLERQAPPGQHLAAAVSVAGFQPSFPANRATATDMLQGRSSPAMKASEIDSRRRIA